MKKAFVIAVLFLIPAVIAFGQTSEVRKVESWWPNGNQKLQGAMKKHPNGEFAKDGKFFTWFENGRKKSQESWKDGVQEGPSLDTVFP